MPLSISTVTKHLTEEIKRPAVHFGNIQNQLNDIHVNVARQFLGPQPEIFTFDLFDESVDEEDTLNFALLSAESEPLEHQGARILNIIANGIAQRLETKLHHFSKNNPAILTIAYEIAAHIGINDFHDVADRVTHESGIQVQHTPNRSVDITISEQGIIYIRRCTHWHDSLVDKKSSGELAIEWFLGCVINTDANGHYLLSGSVTEVALLLRDPPPRGRTYTDLPDLRLLPSAINRFIHRFQALIRSSSNYLTVSDTDIQLTPIVTLSKPEASDHSTHDIAWQGWKVTRENVPTQLTIKKTSPLTAHITSERSSTIDSDHAMEWGSELSRAYLNDKFRFTYSAQHLSINEKLREEDLFALKVLESPWSKSAVLSISKQLADYLEVSIAPKKRQYTLSLFKNFLHRKKGIYPFSTYEMNDFKSLLSFFRHNNSHTAVLSLLWPIFCNGILSSTGTQNIDYLYKTKIFNTKLYDVIATRYDPRDQHRFGNSQSLTSPLFSEENFYPFNRSINYITKKPDAQNKTINRMQEQGIPYISGLSGMANMTCKILHALDIHPFSDLGKNFCEAMSAFIVGTGMHSYYEVYKSFNLYARDLDSEIKTGLFM